MYNGASIVDLNHHVCFLIFFLTFYFRFNHYCMYMMSVCKRECGATKRRQEEGLGLTASSRPQMGGCLWYCIMNLFSHTDRFLFQLMYIYIINAGGFVMFLYLHIFFVVV